MITSSINYSLTKSMDLTEQLNLFFIKHQKKAYAIALISLKNNDDALDVIQDVMIKFVEKYKKKNKTHWASLFFRMIQNRITDFHRSHQQQKKYFFNFSRDEEDRVEQISDFNHVSALQQIESSMKIKQLQFSLENLSTRQLQAFICRIWEGLSVSDTAKSMKCSQGSVKTHLFRALKHIKQQINTEDK